MGTDGGTIDVRVFVEGIELPVLSVETTERLASVSQCLITVPYIRSIKNLFERSLVHVFYYDPSELVFRRAEIPEDSDPNDVFSEVFHEPGRSVRHFKLLFWGEVAGIGRVDGSSGSNGRLTCLGFSNYFDTIRQVAALRGRGTFSDEERRFAGVEEPVSTGSSGRHSTADRVTEILREGGASLQSGIVELVKEFIEGTNAFYRDRSDVLRLSNIIRSLDDDDSADTLMNLDVFRRFMRQSVGRRGVFTIREVLGVLGKILFHDHVEHASPSYFPYVDSEAQRELGSDSLDEETPAVTRENQVDRASSIVFKPELWWSCPPACNVLFPSHYTTIQDGHNKLVEPTRTILKISPGVSGSRQTIADDYFAPDLDALNELAATEEISDQEVFMLPHEKFRGITYNVVMMGEVARLTRRDGYQDYMRSYAQFSHWKSVFSNRTVQVSSQRLLPHVLVGYPAVAIDRQTVDRVEPLDDPNLDERMLLRRELAALRRCLSRLLARRRRLRAYYDNLLSNIEYINWLRRNRNNLGAGRDVLDNRSPQFVEENLDSLVESSIGTVLDTPTYNIQDGERRSDNDSIPPYHLPSLRRALGDQAEAIVPEDLRIRLNPHDWGYDVYLEGVLDTIQEVAADILAQIAALDSQIQRVRDAIRQLRDRLLELGWDLGTYEHQLFCIEEKTISISKGSTTTTLSGRYARVHDEDIDYDGTRGDTLENIIKTGAGEFFSDNYAPDQIGERFYLPTYGIKSLIDRAADLAPFREHEDDAIDDAIFQEADAEIPEWRQVVLEVCQQDFEEVSSSEGMSIADALEIVVAVYRNLGVDNSDAEAFAARFVSRPIATIVDILGSQVLQGDEVELEGIYGNYRGSQALAGVGFHQFAFLSEDETFDRSGLEGRESDQLFVATARRSRVLDYVREITSRDFSA